MGPLLIHILTIYIIINQGGDNLAKTILGHAPPLSLYALIVEVMYQTCDFIIFLSLITSLEVKYVN